jgi:hypothetical protein
MRDKFLRVIELVQALEQSADNTGCTYDLTIVSSEALNTLVDFIVNHCDETELPELNVYS